MNILVVGGGAAGFFGAIAAAQTHPHNQVTLLEASGSTLHKVRISGGGRCNVTHACFDPARLVQHYPRGNRALRGAFSRFHPRHTVQWFEQQGVHLKTETDGRMFPITDDSATIVTCLRQTAQRVGVDLYPRSPVVEVQQDQDQFVLMLKSGESWQGDRLLLATGSSKQGYQLAATLGHDIIPAVPSLFTFNIADPELQELAGLSVPDAQATLRIPNQKAIAQRGALLITHWGMSGPAILKLSAWGARALFDCQYRAELQVNWVPAYNSETCYQTLQVARTDHPRKAIANACPLDLPKRLWIYLIQRSQLPPEQRWTELSNKQLRRFATELTQSHYLITGKGVFKDEFVTCGGVNLKQVNFKTMESRCCPGLYFAGEILDIDGITGGFNFQSAWTTGWLAGQAIGTV